MKSTKVEPITVPKSTSAAPIQRTQAPPKTSFADALASKVEQIANPQQQPQQAAQDAARMEEAKKQFGIVLMRGILAAPKPKKLEKVEAQDGLSDSD